MAATVEEKWGSRKRTAGNSPTAEIAYFVFDTDDDTEAREAAAAEIPGTWDDSGDGLVLDTIDVQQVASDFFEATAKYLSPAAKEAKDNQQNQAQELQAPEDPSEYTFEIGSATLHITQNPNVAVLGSAATTIYSPSGQTAPDFKGAIGVTKDSIDGVDIDFGSYSWSEKKILAPTAINNTYIGYLFDLRRKVNGSTFKGFSAGEVRFMGASGSKRGDGNWEVTYRFEASKNVTGMTIGDVTGISKLGWEYLWVLYQKTQDMTATPPRPSIKVAGVYVEAIYLAGDYSLIGIGT